MNLQKIQCDHCKGVGYIEIESSLDLPPKKFLKKTAAELLCLTDAQLKEYFSPYHKMIKPESGKEDESEVRTKRTYKGPSEMEKTMELMKRIQSKLGIKE